MPHRALAKHRLFPRHPWFSITIVASIAGVLYSSWPLGYRLNPIANRGLASNLEASGQPYNWLFTLLDIASGLLITVVAYKLYQRSRGNRHSWWIVGAIIGLAMFGVLTMIDAVLPIDCVAPAQICKPVFQDPYFVIHGIASIGSINGLTISIICLWWVMIRERRVGSWLRWLLHTVMILWFGFGLGTAELIYRNKSSAVSQHIFIVVCSLWIAAMPYLVQRSLVLQPARRRATRLQS
jgi:hypothetical protein